MGISICGWSILVLRTLHLWLHPWLLQSTLWLTTRLEFWGTPEFVLCMATKRASNLTCSIPKQWPSTSHSPSIKGNLATPLWPYYFFASYANLQEDEGAALKDTFGGNLHGWFADGLNWVVLWHDKALQQSKIMRIKSTHPVCTEFHA